MAQENSCYKVNVECDDLYQKIVQRNRKYFLACILLA